MDISSVLGSMRLMVATSLIWQSCGSEGLAQTQAEASSEVAMPAQRYFSNSSLLRKQFWQFRAGQSSYTVVQPRADLPMRRQMLLYGFSSRLPFLKQIAAPQVDNPRAASELSA